MSTPVFGLLPKEPDARDFAVGAVLRLPKLMELPESFQLPYPTSWVLEQSVDTCAGHASSLTSSFQEGVRLDPLFTWVMARKAKGMQPDDWGCDLRNIASAHQKIGALELSQSPFQESDDGWRDPTVWDTPANHALAILHKKNSYVWIEKTQGYDYFDTVRAALFKFKTPIVIGMRWAYGELPMIEEWQEGGYGHALAVTGWETRAEKLFLVLTNSWGTDSGKDGQYFVTREVINKELPVYGGFTFIDETPEKIREYIEKGIKLNDNGVLTVVKATQYAIIDLAKRVISLLQQLISMEQETTREKILQAAQDLLGKEASPQDLADDDVGCAESVCNVIKKVISDFPIILGTATLYESLKKDKRFRPTLDLNPGNIVISPTGYGNGTIRGHVGIYLGNNRIASNTSKTGLWEDNYSLEEWKKRYVAQGGIHIRVFEAL